MVLVHITSFFIFDHHLLPSCLPSPSPTLVDRSIPLILPSPVFTPQETATRPFAGIQLHSTQTPPDADGEEQEQREDVNDEDADEEWCEGEHLAE